MQTLYNCVYPDSRIKLNKEDWALCNINIKSDDSKKICEYFEKINNRIDISKSSSMQTSEIFVNQLINKLQPYCKEIFGSIEPFCDDVEQGFMVSLFNQKTNDPFYIWSCESKTNQDLIIVTSKEKTNQNLFLNDDLEKAQKSVPGADDETSFYKKAKNLEEFKEKKLNGYTCK